MSESPRNVIIIGSGPAGYTAAIYTGRAGLAPLVFEGSITAGGALMTTTEVENYPGFPDGVQGPELMDKMRTQAERFGAELITDDVAALDLAGEVKVVTDSAGVEHRAHAVILAMGGTYRKLGLPAEEHFSGRGVSWCATCDGFFYRGKQVAVAGGGDSAVEEALFLTRFADKVTLIHRRDQLRASRIMAERAMNDPKIDFAWNSVIEDMSGDASLTGLTLRDVVTGATRELAVDGLFVAIGYIPNSELVAGQVGLDDAGHVLVDDSGQHTNVAGVFACGDLVDPTYRQAITAAGSGCRAALDAQKYLESLEA
ncbi:MAG: thioredoxin-disulfide reductase [Actinomycetia bacterium]|nr:thioredoxin-disulfide reductase [Actinomycetes bacterium]